MTIKTQIGSVTVDAFQWTGGTIPTNLPVWAKRLALHTPGDGSLHVPTKRGTVRALINQWVLQYANGDVDVQPNDIFTSLYS